LKKSGLSDFVQQSFLLAAASFSVMIDQESSLGYRYPKRLYRRLPTAKV